MADDVDLTNDAILADLGRRIAAQQAIFNRPAVTECEDCEEPITPARQALRLNMCLDCAQYRDRAARMFRKD